jgi:hypothetical protein
MAQPSRPSRRRNGKLSLIPRPVKTREADAASFDALMKENAELRHLVVQLSKLVIENALLRK